MTTKGLRYERFECDICHRKQKLELEADKDGSYSLEPNHWYAVSATYTTISLGCCSTPVKKPDPEKIEMCSACASSFKEWREGREY